MSSFIDTAERLNIIIIIIIITPRIIQISLESKLGKLIFLFFLAQFRVLFGNGHGYFKKKLVEN